MIRCVKSNFCEGVKTTILCWILSFIFFADGFHQTLWGWGMIIVIAAPLFAFTDFVQDRLKVEWRNWLTKEMLHAYYTKKAYYLIHQQNNDLDNPDQVSPECLPSNMCFKPLDRKGQIFNSILESAFPWFEYTKSSKRWEDFSGCHQPFLIWPLPNQKFQCCYWYSSSIRGAWYFKTSVVAAICYFGTLCLLDSRFMIHLKEIFYGDQIADSFIQFEESEVRHCNNKETTLTMSKLRLAF